MVNDYGFDKGYIRAGRTISLFAKDGDIADVRILANGALVNAKALGGKARLVNINGELRIGEFSELSDTELAAKRKAEEEAERRAEEERRKQEEEAARKRAEYLKKLEEAGLPDNWWEETKPVH
jgi:hypothetical protein